MVGAAEIDRPIVWTWQLDYLGSIWIATRPNSVEKRKETGGTAGISKPHWDKASLGFFGIDSPTFNFGKCVRGSDVVYFRGEPLWRTLSQMQTAQRPDALP